jgi:hypothetical protein
VDGIVTRDGSSQGRI